MCLTCSALLILCVLRMAKASEHPDEKHLHILITSDLHGWLTTSLLQPGRKPTGLLHLAPAIKSRRSVNTLLLDAGDLISGSPYSYFHNFYQPDPLQYNQFFSLFNDLGYDAVAVGNHDVEIFPLLKKHYLPNSKFTWLSANITKDGKHYFSPYKIFSRNGLKVAVIGLTTAYSKLWASPQTLEGLNFKSSLFSLKKVLRELKQNQKPDLIIGLFHLSLNAFRNDKAGKFARIPSEENVETLLNNTNGLNLVISGHDHRLSPYRSAGKFIYINHVPIIRAGHWGNVITELKLKLIRKNDKFHISEIHHQLIRPDKDKKIAEKYQEQVGVTYKKFLFSPLPITVHPHKLIDAKDCLNDLNSLANDSPQLDGTLLPKAKIYKNISLKGIRRKDIFNWFPYLNTGVKIKLSHRDIERLLDGKGDKRKTYQYVALKMKPSSGFSKKENNTGFFMRHQKRYWVLISNYHYWGGGGWINMIFPKRDTTSKSQNSYDFLRDNLIRYLQQKKDLPESCHFLSYKVI